MCDGSEAAGGGVFDRLKIPIVCDVSCYSILLYV